MPRVAASNGVRPEIRALGVIQLNKPVTPSEINNHVGTGDYAAKYISFLKTRYGCTFTIQKDGKKVVSYTLVGEPENIADLRSASPKVAKAKSVKSAKKVVAKKQKVAKVAKKSNYKKKELDEVEETFGSSGNIAGGSYSVDPDWDAISHEDVSKLI